VRDPVAVGDLADLQATVAEAAEFHPLGSGLSLSGTGWARAAAIALSIGHTGV
jgi:hypothetical protein